MKAFHKAATDAAQPFHKITTRQLNTWRAWNRDCKEKQLSCLHILFGTATKKRSVSITRAIQKWIQHTMQSRLDELRHKELKKQKLLAFVRVLNSHSTWAMGLKVAMAFGRWRSHVECDNVLYFHMQSKATHRVAEALYSHGLRKKMKAMSMFQIAAAVGRERDKYQRNSSARRIALAIIHHRKRALMYGMWKMKQFGNVLHVHGRRRKEHGSTAVIAVLKKWRRKQLLRAMNQWRMVCVEAEQHDTQKLGAAAFAQTLIANFVKRSMARAFHRWKEHKSVSSVSAYAGGAMLRTIVVRLASRLRAKAWNKWRHIVHIGIRTEEAGRYSSMVRGLQQASFERSREEGC